MKTRHRKPLRLDGVPYPAHLEQARRMTRSIRSLGAVALVAVFSLSPPVRAQSGPDQNLLEMRAEQFAGAVSTGRPEEMERLVKDHFDEGMQKIPIAIFMSIEAQAPYRISAAFPVGLIKKVSPSRCHTLRRESAATLRSCASSMRT
jgi:hypothetical protein